MKPACPVPAIDPGPPRSGGRAPDPLPQADPADPVGGVDGAVRLALRVQPGRHATRRAGMHGGRLKVEVAAPPRDGRANAALVAWLAAELDLPVSAVRIARGAGGRDKDIAIAAPIARVRAWSDASDPTRQGGSP